MVIWAKLTQGNGRGTCCWITHNLIIGSGTNTQTHLFEQQYASLSGMSV
jgi:hypothetical protein